MTPIPHLVTVSFEMPALVPDDAREPYRAALEDVALTRLAAAFEDMGRDGL